MIEINFTNVGILNNFDRTLISFWAPWCNACKAQNKMLKNLDKLPSDLVLGSIDVGENRFLAQKYSVTNIPILLLFEKGKVIHRFDGLINSSQLIHELNNLTK